MSPPEIAEPVKLAETLEFPGAFPIVLAETETYSMLPAMLAESTGGEIVLAIGPEGGWTAEELDQFLKKGWSKASLGPTILRAETAAIAAVTIAALGTTALVPARNSQ
jgi:16S rRNA (uracil1498-N3)-methyltransferase